MVWFFCSPGHQQWKVCTRDDSKHIISNSRGDDDPNKHSWPTHSEMLVWTCRNFLLYWFWSLFAYSAVKRALGVSVPREAGFHQDGGSTAESCHEVLGRFALRHGAWPGSDVLSTWALVKTSWMLPVQRQFCSCFASNIYDICLWLFWWFFVKIQIQTPWVLLGSSQRPVWGTAGYSGCIVLRLTSRLAGSIEKIFLPAHDGQGWCGFCSVCKRPLQAIRKVVFALFVLICSS